MKCILTGNETNNKCNNYPVSAEGREILNKVHEAYNAKIKIEFVNKAVGQTESNADDDVEINQDELKKTFARLAPQVSRTHMLRLLSIGVKDAVETLEEVRNGN